MCVDNSAFKRNNAGVLSKKNSIRYAFYVVPGGCHIADNLTFLFYDLYEMFDIGCLKAGIS